MITDKIFHPKRGYVYTIENFAFVPHLVER